MVRDENLIEIKRKIQVIITDLFEEAHRYTENLSHEDIAKLHENHVKDVIYPYIDNTPLLKALVEEKGEENLLESLKASFMKNYNFHEKMLKCEKFHEERKTLYSREEIIENDKKISLYIQNIVKSIIDICKDLNEIEIGEIYFFIFTLIFQSDIEHIPCFKKASETMNMNAVNKMHHRKITDKINRYVSLNKELKNKI